MPDPIDLTPLITVFGPNLYDARFEFDRWVREIFSLRSQSERGGPLLGNNYGITVQWDGTSAPLRPQLERAAEINLNDAADDIGNILASTPDDKPIVLSASETITAETFKKYFSNLKNIKVIEKSPKPGYGGENFGSYFTISYQATASYSTFGTNGTRFLILHELAHNTLTGLAIIRNNFDAHRLEGGTTENYTLNNPWFRRQEAMTNTLVRNIAKSLGISIEPNGGNYAPFPPLGFYEGQDF